MSLLTYLKSLFATDMPLQRFIELQNPQSVYEVEALEKKYQQILKNSLYI